MCSRRQEINKSRNQEISAKGGFAYGEKKIRNQEMQYARPEKSKTSKMAKGPQSVQRA
jgi:hypothetical protein